MLGADNTVLDRIGTIPVVYPEVNCALVTVCLVDIVSLSSAVVPTIPPFVSNLNLYLLFHHSSLHFFLLLSHFDCIFYFLFLVSPINCFFPCFSCSLSGCQFLVCLACWKGKRVSLVYSVSGTFQLACIPASGCVGDKMELIPPGYCYLCFPPVTHKQTYTFTHAQPHEHTLGC